MTYFMAYVILLSAGIGAGALFVELVLRAKTLPTRWTWVVALASVIGVAGVATFAPLPAIREVPVSGTTSLDSAGRSTATPFMPDALSGAASMVQVADAVLPVVWPLASLFLLVAICYGQRRLHRERRDSESRTVNGREVLLTEHSGPAVAGVGRPVVLLPRWVLALDAESQDLLLAHEFEHVRRGDTRLLLLGALGTAVMPWNPMVWWISRRLRLAVEQDCDARVLRAKPDIRRYADLLLMAASHPAVSTRLLAAHFGEHRSDLDRRIRAMTDRTFRWRPTLVAAAIAGALLVASCEAPRPEPLAPRTAGENAAPSVMSEGAVLYEFQVEKPVTQAEGSMAPKYPDILRQAGVEGEVLVSFVVNEEGRADAESFKVLRSTHELFATAVRTALPAMRFVPAQVGGKKVKQLVQQPFSFSLAGTERKTGQSAEVIVAEAKRLAYAVRREGGVRATPNFVIMSSAGQVISKHTGTELPDFDEVKVNDIQSIEVLKGNACSKAEMPCPLITITLKPWTEAAYRKR